MWPFLAFFPLTTPDCTQVHGLTPWPVQAGPEFVHGSNSILVDIMRQAGFKFEEKDWPDWWFFGREGKLIKDDGSDPEVEKVRGTGSEGQAVTEA